MLQSLSDCDFLFFSLDRRPCVNHSNNDHRYSMPFSHHSHSGQFCPGHAVDSLDECIEAAISKGLLVFGLTEHMPRHEVDFYPEERESGATLASHFENEKAYFEAATESREKYKERIGLPVGFECDWIRPESKHLIERSIKSHKFDYFIGSVHHVHATPIDYDQGTYTAAKEIAGGTDEKLFENYFDAQYEMLQAVRPPVIGHFDLIRLKSNDPDVSGGWQKMEGVWSKALRNLDFVASYGGMLEVNTAALRKGMAEPYPKKEIIEVTLPGARIPLTPGLHFWLCRRVSQEASDFACRMIAMELLRLHTGIPKLSSFYLSAV